jgi:hypothetical protein
MDGCVSIPVNVSSRVRFSRASLTAVAIFAAAVSAATASADTVYFNDFETEGSGSEWTSFALSTTPVESRTFLGQFGNETVGLQLGDLPEHEALRLTFDLYIIGSWDGNTQPGPDEWGVRLENGLPLLHTTFAVSSPNSGRTQNFPNWIGDASHPQRTGAAESNTMGYTWSNDVRPVPVQTDAVWHLSIIFPHAGDAVGFQFFAQGLQPLEDEAWGIDNVRVEASVIPAPGALGLAMTTLGFAARRRRR